MLGKLPRHARRDRASPAMLFYLDNFQSRAPGSDVAVSTRGQVPNLQQRLPIRG
jgi:hypothetical protein